jgi:tripartite-type tricarboxylate transporter receptor subunit TctC
MKSVRLVFSALAVVFGISLFAVAVQAQPYPNHPIQLVIPIPAGGGGDVNGRILVEELGKILGQKVIVTNKAGAGDTVGTDAVAKSKKDGYTIAYTSSAAMVYSRILNPENVPYDAVKDLEPLGLHVYFPLTIAVQESSPWKTFWEWVAYAKKNPGKIRISTPGTGSTAHFNLELMQSLTGAEFTHVPFKGGEAVITALLGGHVEATFDAIGKIMPHLDAGKMRVLVTSKKIPLYPNIPTMTELGYKQELLSAWFALFAPVGIPEDVKKVLVSAVEKGIKSPEVKAKIESRGYIVDYKTPAELRKLIVSDYEKALSLGLKIDPEK